MTDENIKEEVVSTVPYFKKKSDSNKQISLSNFFKEGETKDFFFFFKSKGSLRKI